MRPWGGRCRRGPVGTTLLLLLGGCGDSGAPPGGSETYFAVAYGLVTQQGAGVQGVEIGAEVFLEACPGDPSRLAGDASTRSGSAGRYRLLLTSTSPAAGQCAVLTPAGGAPVARTLAETPFSATEGEAVSDSVEINLEIP